MTGEITNLIAILGVGIAGITVMFTMFRSLERRIDKLETTVQQLVKDVSELKGAVNVIRDGLRISVGEPADPD